MKWFLGIVACFVVSFIIQLAGALLNISEKISIVVATATSMAAFISVLQYYEYRKSKRNI